MSLKKIERTHYPESIPSIVANLAYLKSEGEFLFFQYVNRFSALSPFRLFFAVTYGFSGELIDSSLSLQFSSFRSCILISFPFLAHPDLSLNPSLFLFIYSL